MTHALDLLDRATNDARSQAAKPRAPEGERPVYRLRDLNRPGRWVSVVFAAALSMAPLLAVAWAVPDWAPAGDTAIMGLRALDVGTSRTPLIGQLSTGTFYARARSITLVPRTSICCQCPSGCSGAVSACPSCRC